MIDLVPQAAPVLRFALDAVEPLRTAAVPTLRMRVRIASDGTAPILGLGLNVDVRIAAERRRYTPDESERLREVFGHVGDWARSLGPIAWTRATINVPAFDGDGAVDVDLPCGYDFDIVAVKYATALDGGEIPADALFTGNIFYGAADGRLQTAKIPWDSDVSLRVPLAVWHAAVEAAIPGAAWLRLDRALLRRLQTYRAQRGFAGWDETVAALLDRAEP